MYSLTGLNILAVAGTQIVNPSTAQASNVDATLVFGFFSAFCTLVVLMYQDRLRSRIPLLVICLAALSIYGFLEGTWALGFSLLALCASEFRRCYFRKRDHEFRSAIYNDHPETPDEPKSRLERMFGSR